MDAFCKTIELGLNQSVPGLDFINVNASSFLGVCNEKRKLELDSAAEAKYSAPMPLIGAYITIAMIICGLFMMFEVNYAIACRKFWFPMKYFSLNAASLTVIAVAMKLPMDLTSPMPDDIDQFAKVGSLAFLCIIMCNLLPSLAATDNKSLLANVTALSILVITLVVNVGIEIGTQLILHRGSFHPFPVPPIHIAAYIYEGMLLFLLIIYISSAIAIPSLKEVIELKYQATLNDQNLQENITFNVEELRQILKRHWIMVQTSSPQFVLATTPLSSASSVICAISMVVYASLFCHEDSRGDLYASVYKRSTAIIPLTQIAVVAEGSIGSIYRCFAVLRFKSSANQSCRNHFSVFKVDKYWTQQLCEWKDNPLRLSLFLEVDFRMKNIILSCFIGFQRVVVVLCSMIELIPIGLTIFFSTHCSSYFKSLKALLFTPPTASSSEDTDEDLSNYVLSLKDNVQQVTKRSFKIFLDSMNRQNWINRFLKRVTHENLLTLLEKSDTFEGVGAFDVDQSHSLPSTKLVNSWSLPIISLTCIAIVFPNIDKDVVDKLLKSVDEGLFFTRIVEESLTKASEYVTTRTLWHKVIDEHKWLDITLKKGAYEGKTPMEIIKLFADSSKEIILSEFNISTNDEQVKVITANSMYRIAQTILFRYESNGLEITEDELFAQLSNMIADILAACLTNIPKVIIMKCRETAVEKRADSVKDAVKLLEETSEIIKRLGKRELPNMDPEKTGFIEEWHLHYKQP